MQEEDIRYLLHKMMVIGGEIVTQGHPWVSEADRWKELVFALVTQVTSMPHGNVREATNQLQALGLLDISQLTEWQLAQDDKEESKSGRFRLRFTELLVENGFTDEEADLGFYTVCEAAAGLSANYNGKIQFYLRYYGELMLKELPGIFHFSGLDNKQTAYAFTYWMQNVLNMPVSLSDATVESFSKSIGILPAELFAAADSMDISVAVVDDLVHLTQAPDDDDDDEGESSQE